MHKFNIQPDHYKYLKNQCGDINSIKDFKEWKYAYDNKINFLMGQIKPYIPHKCDNVLDIGSGLGGIDVLVAKHTNAHIELVDGHTQSEVIKSNIPHSNHNVMADFLEKNGIKNYTLSSPYEFESSTKDVIISYSAWCFHIDPDVYLSRVLECCHEKTVLFIKVRHGIIESLKPYFDIEIIERKKKADLVCMKTL